MASRLLQQGAMSAGALWLACTAPFGEAMASQQWPIQSVTVFTDGTAKVTRAYEAKLQSGSHTLALPDLPGQVVKGSLRASLEGDGAQIQALHASRETGQPVEPEKIQKMRDRLEMLKEQREQIGNHREAARQRLALLDRLAELPPSEAADALLGEGAERFDRLLERVEQDGASTRNRISKLQKERQQLQTQIADLRRQIESLESREQDRVSARLQVHATESAHVDLEATYRVKGAQWTPIYAARLDTQAGTVKLERAVEVRQRTGEDWSNVHLTLNSSQAPAGAPPSLHTWWVHLQQPQTTSHVAELQRMAADTQHLAKATGSASAQSTIQTKDTGFSVRHEMAQSVTLAADNQPQRLALGTQTLETEIRARVAPQRSQRAWLIAEVEWPGEHALSAGKLRRYRDGAYLGEQRLESWSPGEVRTLSFGVDPRVEVTYTALRDRAEEGGWWGQHQKLARRYRLHLHNQHAQRALPVVLRYRLPTPKDEKIKVEPAKAMPEPDERTVDGRKGVWAWRWHLEAGERKRVDLGFDLTYPEKARLHGVR